MKKIYRFTFALLAVMFAFTSCDTDEQIADYLISGNWKGSLATYYVNRWGEAFNDGEFYTVWRFEPGTYDRDGYARSGYGYEADYNVYDDREFVYSSFRWEVRNGNIYIYYDDPAWNPVRIDWRDYSISYSYFHGTMYDWENRAYDFDLTNVGSWNWNRYRYRTQTRAAASDVAASDAVSSEAFASDSVYVSANGKSIATGRFAAALRITKNEE